MFPTLGTNPMGINVEASIGPPSQHHVTVSRPLNSYGNSCDRLFDCLVYFTRFWGLLTAVVLAGVGIDFLFHGRYPGYWLIAFSIFIFVAESLWIVTLFLKLSIRTDNKIWRIWKYFTMFEGWKKSPFYLFVGLITLIKPYKLWLVYMSSGQTISLGVFHLLVSIFQKVLKRRRKRRDHRFGHNDMDSLESSKFEEVTEVLDDCIPEPIPGSSVSLSDSLHIEQDNVLEI